MGQNFAGCLNGDIRNNEADMQIMISYFIVWKQWCLNLIRRFLFRPFGSCSYNLIVLKFIACLMVPISDPKKRTCDFVFFCVWTYLKNLHGFSRTVEIVFRSSLIKVYQINIQCCCLIKERKINKWIFQVLWFYAVKYLLL